MVQRNNQLQRRQQQRANVSANRLNSSRLRPAQQRRLPQVLPRSRYDFQYRKEVERVNRINNEVKIFNEGLSIGNFARKYNQLSPEAKKLVESQKTEFEKIMKTQAGKLEWAKQNGVKPQIEYGRVARGYSLEPFREVYNTPFGRVIDNSLEVKARKREARNDARAAGYKNVKAFQEALGFAKAAKSNVLVSPSGKKIALNAAGAKKIQTQAIRAFNNPPQGLTIKQFRNIYGVDPKDISNLTIKKTFEMEKAWRNPQGITIKQFREKFGVDPIDLANSKIRVLPPSKTTGAEASAWFGSKIETTQQNYNRVLSEYNKAKRKFEENKTPSNRKELLRLANERDKLKNRLIGLESGARATDILRSLPVVVSAVKQIVEDPKNVVPLGAAFWSGIKADWKETLILSKTSPSRAIGKVGTDIVTIQLGGGVLRVVGKLRPIAAAKVRPIVKNYGLPAGKLFTTIKRSGNSFKVVPVKINPKITREITRVKKVNKARLQTKKAKKDLEAAKKFARDNARVRKLRATVTGRGKTTTTIGTSAYDDALRTIESYVDNLSKVRAKRFVKELEKRGLKIGLGEQDNFIRAYTRFSQNNLRQLPGYKQLKVLAGKNKPVVVRLIKKGKVDTAKTFYNKLKTKVGANTFSNKVARDARNLIRKTKKLKPSRVKKRIKKASLRRQRVRDFKKTNRYKMDKSRPLKKVSLAQLKTSTNINTMRKLVDNLFDEMARRNKIPIDSLKYRQFKNQIKKRLDIAVRKKDKKTIESFMTASRAMIKQMDSPSKRPSVKIQKKTGAKKAKRIMTIKDFQSETPKGTYKEVKVGNQVLLQKTGQVQKTKQVQKARQVQTEVYVIKAVTKTKLNLKPMFNFLLEATALGVLQTLRTKLKTGQAFNQNKLLGVLQAETTTITTLQNVALSLSPAVNVRLNLINRVKRAYGTPTKTTTVSKKKVVKLKTITKKKTKKLSKAIQTYGVEYKSGKKFVKANIPPMTQKDARDYLTYIIDNNPSRSAKIVARGKRKEVGIIPSTVRGYYTRNKKKVRTYKIKRKKKQPLSKGYIEKRKYALDKKGERSRKPLTTAQKKVLVARLKKARAAKQRSKSPAVRKVRKRVKVIQKKRKLTAAQKKVLLKRLAKARAVRNKNLRSRKANSS